MCRLVLSIWSVIKLPPRCPRLYLVNGKAMSWTASVFHCLISCLLPQMVFLFSWVDFGSPKLSGGLCATYEVDFASPLDSLPPVHLAHLRLSCHITLPMTSQLLPTPSNHPLTLSLSWSSFWLLVHFMSLPTPPSPY
jgi:hypothetical protein